MILSHSHGFIFVKTLKTAGTSVEISLSRYCGDADVVTPIGPNDEAQRAALGVRPRNFSESVPVSHWRRRELGELRRGRWPRRASYWNHMTAEQIRSRASEEWDRYVTFTIVRNPWDAFVSRYFWVQHASGVALTVDEALERFDPAQNWLTYTINGEVAVDVVCRYETIDADLDALARRVGIDFDGWLPRAKTKARRVGTSLHDVLTPRHIDQIAERCATEIQRFSYELPSAGCGPALE